MDSNEVALWQSIKTSALLGTERQPFQPLTAAGKLGQILNLEQTQKSEAALLLSAAILSLYQQAGQQAQKVTTQKIDPCEPEDQPRCSSHAASFLERILQAESVRGAEHTSDRLTEWLAIAQQKGQRVPELYLSKLLDFSKLPYWRDRVLPVIGKRGRWLAAQNPDWSYITEDFADFDWTTSPHQSRLSYLKMMRHREPDRARELLQSTWKEESADARLEFLREFKLGLSSTDEPFLEEVLNDRSKYVRREAAQLLVQLPNSQYCDRMIQRLAALIKFNSQTLEVNLPTACDAAMKRDGVEPKSNYVSIGERGWWLKELIIMTPLDFWLTHLSIANISTLIELSLTSEWKDILLDGLQRATIWQKNATWTNAILEQPHYSECPGITHIDELIKVLSLDQRDQLCLQLLKTRSIDTGYVLSFINQLAWNRGLWSKDLTSAVLQKVFNHLSDLKNFIFLPERIAPCIHPESIADAIHSFSTLQQNPVSKDVPKQVLQRLEDTIALLKFRQDMIQSFEN